MLNATKVENRILGISKAVWIETGSRAKIRPGESGLRTTPTQGNPRSNEIAIKVKPSKPSPSRLAPPGRTIRAGSPDGKGASLGATFGVPAVEDVDVGRSGSVGLASGADSLKLEKLRDISVCGSSWELVGVGVEVGVEVIDDEGRPEFSEGKTTVALYKSQHRETISREG